MTGVLVRGGRVNTPQGTQVRDVLIVHDQIIAVAADLSGVTVPGVVIFEIDAAGQDVFAGFVDQHCHPTGGGGGQGPASQNLPLMFEEFTTAGITSLVGVLGHDTVVRTPPALLARVRALQTQGLRASMLTGQISAPPATLTGQVSSDIALIDDVRGLKIAIGELGAINTVRELVDLAAAVAAGARTAGRLGVVHVHIASNPACLDLVEEAVRNHGVPASLLTITHVNWNQAVLERSIELAALGVNLDVTACITLDYFAGTVAPHEALATLVASVPLAQLTASSDSGGSHPGPDGLVVHTPGLLLEVAMRCLADGVLTGAQVAAIFSANPAIRNSLEGVGQVEPGTHGDLVIVDPAVGATSATVILGGRLVVTAGHATVLDPLSRTAPVR